MLFTCLIAEVDTSGFNSTQVFLMSTRVGTTSFLVRYRIAQLSRAGW